MAKSQGSSFLPPPRILTRGVTLFFSLILGILSIVSGSVSAQTIYSLTGDQASQGTHNWTTASDWSGSVAPSDTTGAIFTVGAGKELRTPSSDATFPAGTGSGNKLYVGYQDDGVTYDTAVLRIKASSVTINDLYLGKGTIYQGISPSTSATLNGSIFVNGDSYLTLPNDNASDTRSLAIGSSIAGHGDLHLTTKNKTTSGGGFTLTQSQNDFSGNLSIDGNSRVTISGENAFYKASSVTSSGVLTLSAEQTFKNFSGSGSIANNGGLTLDIEDSNNKTYSGVFTGTGSITKTGSGTLTLSSGSNNSVSGNLVINQGTVVLANKITGNNRFANGTTVTINNGTLECRAGDAIGNGGTSTGYPSVTFNLKGGSIKLETTENQTFVNKTVNLTGGTIGSSISGCKGIHIKGGNTFNALAANDATEQKPTVSYIDVPMVWREDGPLSISVAKKAELIFTKDISLNNTSSKNINKTGDGTLTFTNNFTIGTGTTTVSAGVLKLTGNAVEGVEGIISVEDGGTLELNVSEYVKKLNADSFKVVRTDLGEVVKTGDGTLQLCNESQDLIDINGLVVSSGRMDILGYMTGGITVEPDSVFSPGNSVGDARFGGGYELKEGATLLIEQEGDRIDTLTASSFNIDSNSIIDIVADSLQPGAEYPIIVNSTGAFSGDLQNDNFWNGLLTSGSDYYWNLSVRGDTVYATVDGNAVPEPSTWALLVLGVVGLLLRKRVRS